MPVRPLARRIMIGIAVPLTILLVLASGPVRSEPMDPHLEPPVPTAQSVISDAPG